MPSNNYFRAGYVTFTFDDRRPEEIERAFSAASASGPVAMWRVPPTGGPWDAANIVGHRSRELLERQLARDAQEMTFLRDPLARHKLASRRAELLLELSIVEACWRAMGRSPRPLAKVGTAQFFIQEERSESCA